MRNKMRRLRLEWMESRAMLASVSMLDAIQESPDRSTTPVQVQDAPGLRAAEIHLQYDPATTKIDADGITAGSVWGNQAAVVANIDEVLGSVIAFVFSTNPAPQSSGTLIQVDVKPATAAGLATTRNPTLDLQKVQLNEGDLTLIASPQVGPDSTDQATLRATDVLPELPVRKPTPVSDVSVASSAASPLSDQINPYLDTCPAVFDPTPRPKYQSLQVVSAPLSSSAPISLTTKVDPLGEERLRRTFWLF